MRILTGLDYDCTKPSSVRGKSQRCKSVAGSMEVNIHHKVCLALSVLDSFLYEVDVEFETPNGVERTCVFDFETTACKWCQSSEPIHINILRGAHSVVETEKQWLSIIIIDR